MTVTALDRALVAGDAGRVTGEQRPDPEVPEKARRRSFTAQYKLDVVAEYDAAPAGEKGAVMRREACIPVTQSSGGGPGTLARWPARRGRGGRPAADPQDAQIARLQNNRTMSR